MGKTRSSEEEQQLTETKISLYLYLITGSVSIQFWSQLRLYSNLGPTEAPEGETTTANQGQTTGQKLRTKTETETEKRRLSKIHFVLAPWTG